MPARKQSIGVLGLGLIGSRVAANLRRAGHEVWVWSRSPRTEPNFLGSAAEVAEAADIILLFVADGPALLETVGRLQPTLAARHLVINCATVAPDEVREAARLVGQSSALFVEAPFTGSRDAAAAAQIVFYLAGPPEAMERARVALEPSAKAIIEVGSEIGQAAGLKLAANLLVAAVVEGLAEAIALADANGVSPTKFAEAFALHGARSPLGDMKLPALVNGEFEPHFALKHMFKDIQLALKSGQEHGIALPVAAATGGALAAAIQHGWGELDFAALGKHFDFPGRETIESANAAPAPAPAPKRFSFFGK